MHLSGQASSTTASMKLCAPRRRTSGTCSTASPRSFWQAVLQASSLGFSRTAGVFGAGFGVVAGLGVSAATGAGAGAGAASAACSACGLEVSAPPLGEGEHASRSAEEMEIAASRILGDIWSLSYRDTRPSQGAVHAQTLSAVTGAENGSRSFENGVPAALWIV